MVMSISVVVVARIICRSVLGGAKVTVLILPNVGIFPVAEFVHEFLSCEETTRRLGYLDALKGMPSSHLLRQPWAVYQWISHISRRSPKDELSDEKGGFVLIILY